MKTTSKSKAAKREIQSIEERRV